MGFHQTLFVIVCILAICKGAIDAGREDLLTQYTAKHLLQLSLYELGNVPIRKI